MDLLARHAFSVPTGPLQEKQFWATKIHEKGDENIFDVVNGPKNGEHEASSIFKFWATKIQFRRYK